MLGRGRAGVRELDTAEDPVAVLVWAADVTAAALGRTGAEPGEDHRRLALLDAAIDRQRKGRLAMAEIEAAGPLHALLGPPPHNGAGLAAWRRAAGAVLDYRDAAGTFERDVSLTDPWRRALGDEPAGTSLRSHYDQVRETILEARTTMVLAELARHVPVAGRRPSVEVETLARRPLGQLHAELAHQSRHTETATRSAAAVRSAQRELARAEQALAELSEAPAAPARRRRSRVSDAELIRAEARARAAHRVVEARARLAATSEVVSRTPEAPSRQRALLTEAVAVREERLRSRVLDDAPDWARHDIRRRLAADDVLAPPIVEGLARAYGDIAVFCDRWGLGAGSTTLDQLVGALPPAPGAHRDWLELSSRLRSPGVAPERGIDLSL